MFYGTLQGAQDYFGTKLFAELWDQTPVSDRKKALETATRLIDTLAFKGEKTAAFDERVELLSGEIFGDEGRFLSETIRGDPDKEKQIAEAGLTQELQFPRGGDTTVPIEIEQATYELAFALLDGRDADKDLEQLAVTSQGFAGVRTQMDRSFVHEHLIAGIPSATAWRFLKPFLREDQDVKVQRVS